MRDVREGRGRRERLAMRLLWSDAQVFGLL
eukprot:SAG25_NODE_14771_length_251_cov_0.671053_1_plen_29_part_01